MRRKSDYEADKQVIPGAVWHDPEKAEQWGKDLPKEKDIIIYCVKGGSVSKSVLDRLLEKKVKACYIEGGIIAWKECGGEVTAK